MNNDSIYEAVVYLYDKERFYAELLSNMTRVLTKSVPVAGVCVKDRIELHINLDTFSPLTVQERAAVLKHECEHILRDHISRGKKYSPETYAKSKDPLDGLLNNARHRVINIAADMAINGGVRDLPEGAVYAHEFNLPPGETMEWYAGNLKDHPKLKDLTHFDDHSLWDESTETKDIIKEKIRKLVTAAAAKARAAGRLSGEHELLVNELNSAKVDWRSQLRRFVARSNEIKIESSKKKRNRRYGIRFPGDVKIETLHIGVAVDTSGSTSDEDLTQFMSEIHRISKFARVTVVEADTTIKNAYVYDPKKKYKVKGRGGTAYKPAFDYFNDLGDIDGMIYFGDMDCFDTEEILKPKYRVLWVIVGHQEPPAKFGAKIYIK